MVGVHPKTGILGVILRSDTTKNLEILRGVYPESTGGLRITFTNFRMKSSYLSRVSPKIDDESPCMQAMSSLLAFSS